MRRVDKLLLRVRSLLRRERIDHELDDELRFHLEQQIEENLAAGMTPEEARYAAVRAIGGLPRIKEECRDMRRVNFVVDLRQDLRYALRILHKNPGFTAVAVLSLALGIGINTAVFSVVDAMLLKMLPVKTPERLVLLTARPVLSFSYPMYQDLRDGNSVLNGLLCRFTIPMDVNISGNSERIAGELVSGNYFQVLGVSALVGRTLTPEDTRVVGGQPVVVLSNGFWKRRFGSDPGIVGRTIRLDGYPLTVVGITPAGFGGIEVGASPDVRVPITMVRAMLNLPSDLAVDNRGWRWLDLMGRLKPGVSPEQAQAMLNTLHMHLRERETEKVRSLSEGGLWVEPGGRGYSELRESFSRPLGVLMVAVSIVLLIACANVAGLLLARATARQREIAVRLALGASRARVVRLLVTESVLLSLMAAFVGLLIARWGSNLLVSFLPQGRLPLALNVDVDFRALAFTVIVSIATGIVFGLAPGLQITRPALAPMMKHQEGSSGIRDSLTFRRGLIVLQVALSVVLLAGAGLFVRTLHNLKAVDVGYDRQNILMLSLDPSLSGYSDDETARFYGQILERVNSLAGVRSAGIGSMGLLGQGLRIDGVRVEGDARHQETGAWINFVSPLYFKTLDVPVLLGRDFDARDTKAAPKVAIVNQTCARYFFGNENPIGRRLREGEDKTSDTVIVGVVRDGKYKSVRDQETPNVVYFPFTHKSGPSMTLHVRTVGDPTKMAAAIRREVQAVDMNVPVYDVRTLEAQLDKSLSQERLVATLSSCFGSVAMLLASIGLYGVMAYSVTRRTKEIGIRMALGAEHGGVVWMVLREGLLLAGAGVAIGVPVALALARFLSSLLYGLKPTDPLTISAAGVILFVIAAVASYLPARRASRVSPMVALRYE